MKNERIDLEYLWHDLSEWSQKTFGSDSERGPIGPLKHLILEANEAIEKPQDISEFADCLILVFDAARRAGFTFNQLEDAAIVKHGTNKYRYYPKPVGDEVSQHVKGS